MIDFTAEPADLVAAEVSACERVLRSGLWVLGGEVASFEKEWARWLDVEEAVGCGNGLDAIEIALRCLGIGDGHEVVTTPMTAFATVLAVIRSGATPVLADVDMKTAMLDPKSVERCIGRRTRAILLVHLYGRIGPVEELRDLAASHGLDLIEDCAQAHGASLGGRAAGSFGRMAAWSFYPTKTLGAVGDGGAVTTRELELADRARAIRNYGQVARYQHQYVGMNSRLDEIQAALLRERFRFLPAWIERRRTIARAYVQAIKNPDVEVAAIPSEPNTHAFHLFVVMCRQREQLRQHLSGRGIQSIVHYPVPIHRQKPCFGIARDTEGLTIAEAHSERCLSLPCHPHLTDEDVGRVIEAVNSFKG
ncbi:MAG: DegT/DnrJ/EryC1/StrS family aminotransferase [Nitrososphaerales archaeon]